MFSFQWVETKQSSGVTHMFPGGTLDNIRWISAGSSSGNARATDSWGRLVQTKKKTSKTGARNGRGANGNSSCHDTFSIVDQRLSISCLGILPTAYFSSVRRIGVFIDRSLSTWLVAIFYNSTVSPEQFHPMPPACLPFSLSNDDIQTFNVTLRSQVAFLLQSLARCVCVSHSITLHSQQNST